jgi:hypothetical protein
LILLLGTGFWGLSTQAEEWTYSHPVTERDAFVSAEFSLNLDPGIEKVNSVIVLIGAQNIDMRPWAKEDPWNRIALRLGCAVVGCKFVNAKDGDFSRVERGGRIALLDCLVEFSKKSPRLKDLSRLKLILVGNMAGAQFAYEFANRESDKTAGFVCINPYYFYSPATGALRKVPALFLVTENENPVAASSVRALYSQQRRLGALWAGLFLNTRQSRNLPFLLQAPFVEETLIARIRRNNPLGSLENHTVYDGWSLDLTQFSPPTITESKNVPRGKEEQFAWFISESLAQSMAKLLITPVGSAQ